MPRPSSPPSRSQGQTGLWLSNIMYLSQCTSLTFVLRQVSLVDGLFDLVVGSFGIQIHGPAEVHQSQVSLTQFLIHLRQWDRHAAVRQAGASTSIICQRSCDVRYLSYEKVNQRLFGNDLLQLLQLLKSCLQTNRSVKLSSAALIQRVKGHITPTDTNRRYKMRTRAPPPSTRSNDAIQLGNWIASLNSCHSSIRVKQ